MPFTVIFQLISTLILIYGALCFVRIIITWFPSAEYSSLGRSLAAVCDPYLNLFRRIRWLRTGALDFSPAVALCVLVAVYYLVSAVGSGVSLHAGDIVVMIIELCWSIVSSVLSFLIVLLIIRLLVLIFSNGYSGYGTFWDQFDRAISPLLFRIPALFSRGRPVPFRTALIISLVSVIVVRVFGAFLIMRLCILIKMLLP